MTNLILKNEIKSQRSPARKTFDKLINKIKDLQEWLKLRCEDLDQGLMFYHEELGPLEKKARHLLSECTKRMFYFYKNPKGLSKKEQHELKKTIVGSVTAIINEGLPTDVDPEIRAIFKDIKGVDFDEIVREDFDEMRQAMEAMLKEEGLDIDLSKINAFSDRHSFEDQLREAMHDAHAKMEREEPQPKKKTKRQLAKEEKAQELEALQQKGISTIYKQLAKVLHPDLEQDPVLRAQKEALMKKLTTAYRNDDLLTLLSLEMEWMNMDRDSDAASSSHLKSDAQLKIYNSVLKDQVKELEHAIHNAHRHHRYFSIAEYASDGFLSPTIPMTFKCEDEQDKCNIFQMTLQGLLSPNPLKTLRDIIRDD